MSDSDKANKGSGYMVDFSEREIDSVKADEVKLNQCNVQSIQAEKIQMDKSAVLFMAAEKIEAKNSAAMIMLAKETSGDIRPIISLPAALIIAGAILLGFAIFRKE